MGTLDGTSDFESQNYFYSNYKLELTAQLLYDDGTMVPGSDNNGDHIIYTNACVNASYVE